MRIALLTEGGYPYPSGDGWVWCDRLVRGLADQELDVYARTRAAGRPPHRLPLPGQVRRVAELPLDGPPPAGPGPRGRAARRRFRDAYRELAGALADAGNGTPHPDADGGSAAESTTAGSATGSGAGGAVLRDPVKDRFADGLYALADLAREYGGLGAAPLGQSAMRALEDACRAPGAARPVAAPRPRDLLAAAEFLERALRPLSAPWYGADALGGADLCHAASGGPAALPGVLAARWCGTPLLVTEYAVRLREHYLRGDGGRPAPAVRALSGAFHRLLAGEVYRHADALTAGNAHVRRWQEHCGADRARITTVHPGMNAAALTAVGEASEAAAPDPDDTTLVWVGRIGPAKDLVALLHAFAEIRGALPAARLRIIADGPADPGYLAQCRALAAQLFPDEAADTVTAGESPVAFEEVGSPYVPTPADAYAAGGVVVLSSAVEGFPGTLVEAMFCGRPTVSTDVGAVREVIGGTGLVVPARNPHALAEACGALLRDPVRRSLLGAAARARALELFTVERNVAAFRALYLDLVAHRPARPAAVPFTHPAEAHVPGHWTAPAPTGPGWAASATVTTAAITATDPGTPAPAALPAAPVPTASARPLPAPTAPAPADRRPVGPGGVGTVGGFGLVGDTGARGVVGGVRPDAR
ncbi:glycosyltransferase [Streptantibioticus silvisoli]|uniref:D-inositol 3-phosphate glycosyltransferase n=1 Tax=Streptantibioticus silvisoli TaxID=2705255 RepID=A0ABT6VZF3_9ACTN|nr:glycosyltransferase [Streptantibioticus silvisoli]MDI5963869.1 DUF3492 domain-containing protein [Streptantibioticus silvisoli]